MKIYKLAKTIWIDDLIEDNLTVPSPQELLSILRQYAPQIKIIGGKQAIIITVNGVKFVAFDEAFPLQTGGLSFEDVESWVWTIDPTDFDGMISDFNEDFWSSPPSLYHATTEENKDGILQHGILPRNRTRGIGNRGIMAAVFTTTEPDDLVGGSYGNVIFKIDTQQMKADGITPFVSREPTEEEADARESIAHAIGLENFCCDRESGIYPTTVFLREAIPAKYLSTLGN